MRFNNKDGKNPDLNQEAKVAAVYKPVNYYTTADEEQINEEKAKKIRAAKIRQVLLLCCFPSLILVAIFILGLFFTSSFPIYAATSAITAETASALQQESPKLVSARWSWSFNISDILNAEANVPIRGKEGGLRLGSNSGCRSPKWRPYVERKSTGEIPILLKYVDGPPNFRAMRSLLLIADDGRELMVGNDFHRNSEGYKYNIGQYDDHAFALNPTLLQKMAGDALLTLKIEVIVDPATINCKFAISEKANRHESINYKEECERLQTSAKLFVNGSCYVGSNTPTQFAFAYRQCNHIPSAAISRLAWIESSALLNELRDVMKSRHRSGEIVNNQYYIGAKYFPGADDSSPNKGWQWIDSNSIPNKSLPKNSPTWKEGHEMEQHRVDHDYIVVFKNQESKISAVSADEWAHYLCEYRERQ